MRSGIVIKVFEEYSTCPICGKDITDYEIKDEVLEMNCDGCDWDLVANEYAAEALV